MPPRTWRTLRGAEGGVCAMRAAESRPAEDRQITALPFDGPRYDPASGARSVGR
ncbi:hypothetical protein [Actinomadura nitritigenes]|uniref:hypothetical protein n=1 Tax=Actinomadura nitritigenes TaxID=134602 RepID=UPI003D8A5149